MRTITTSAVALLALVPAIVPAPGAAQDIALDDIIVSATRAELDRNRIGVSAVLVDAEDLEKAGDTSVAAVLARLPGISLSAQGPFGNAANLRIRGADGRYLAVFIDGVRVGDPTGVQTSFDFGSLMAADIGRIEILRGSQSALWGGSAVGGVINIETRRPTEEGTAQRLAAEAGSHGTASLSYGLTQKTGRFEASFSATHLTTDGYSAAAAGTEDDGARATRLSFSTRFQATDALAFGASAFVQDTTQEYDGYGPAFTLVDQDNVQDRREAGARLFAEIAAGNTAHVVEMTYYDIARDYDQEGALSSFDGSRLGFAWQATTTVSDRLFLVYGADTMTEKARYSNLAQGVADSRISGAFAQAVWSPIDTLDLSAAVRVDDDSVFGRFETGRIALAWRPREGTTLRAAIATGFRAPSLDERYGDYPGAFPFVGNPELTPEESTSFEIGVEQAFAGGATVSATLFDLGIDNLITYQFGTPATLVNLAGDSARKGVELAADIPVGDRFAVGLAYTYTDALRPDGTRLGLVPRHDLTVSLDADLSDRMTAGVTVKHVADRLDDFAAVALDDYTVVGAQVSYDLTDRAAAYLRVENLFDEEYELSSGYATSGRAVYAGIRASF